MVDAPAAASHEPELTSLRAELKEWEHTFATNNGGRKAGRDDIKRNGEIGTTGRLNLSVLFCCMRMAG